MNQEKLQLSDGRSLVVSALRIKSIGSMRWHLLGGKDSHEAWYDYVEELGKPTHVAEQIKESICFHNRFEYGTV